MEMYSEEEKRFYEGPILPESISREEWNKVAHYIISIGFHKTFIKE